MRTNSCTQRRSWRGTRGDRARKGRQEGVEGGASGGNAHQAGRSTPSPRHIAPTRPVRLEVRGGRRLARGGGAGRACDAGARGSGRKGRGAEARGGGARQSAAQQPLAPPPRPHAPRAYTCGRRMKKSRRRRARGQHYRTTVRAEVGGRARRGGGVGRCSWKHRTSFRLPYAPRGIRGFKEKRRVWKQRSYEVETHKK